VCALAPHPRFQTVITPSEEASQRHLAATSQRLSQLRSASQARVIEELNPLIDGWAAYYQGVVPAETLGRYDEFVERLLLRWARGQHPIQTSDWLLTHYWRRIGEQAKVFATPEGTQLRSHRRPDMPRESQQKEPVTPADGHLQQGRQNFMASPVMQQTTDYLSAQEGQDGADNRGEAAPSDRDHPSNQAAEKAAAPSSWL
jgi:RNA-directed DNA polymerase